VKLHLAPDQGQQLITGYGADYVAVNKVRYEASVVVSPQGVVEWPVERFDALAPAHFGFIAGQRPEIVIFGTGRMQRFPPPALARELAKSGVGIEVMDTGAACRTYNILAAEGRKVVAAILIEREAGD
jgi:uncharacterized protein